MSAKLFKPCEICFLKAFFNALLTCWMLYTLSFWLMNTRECSEKCVNAFLAQLLALEAGGRSTEEQAAGPVIFNPLPLRSAQGIPFGTPWPFPASPAPCVSSCADCAWASDIVAFPVPIGWRMLLALVVLRMHLWSTKLFSNITSENARTSKMDTRDS